MPGDGALWWSLLVPLLLGVLALRAIGFGPDRDRLSFCGLVWPAGCLVLGWSLHAMLLLRIEPRFWWVVPLFAALALLLLPSQRGAACVPPGTAAPRAGPWFFGFVLVGAACVLVQVIAGASRPCVEGDEGNIWGLQGKSLLVDYFTGDYAAAQRFNLHPDYPLLNPLLQAWVQSQHGRLLYFTNRLPIQLCALSSWLLLCAALRHRLPGWCAALLAATVLLSEPFRSSSRTAYADGMVALGVLIAGDAWLRAKQGGGPVWHRVAALGAAFALWSKNEAMLYAAAAAAAAAIASAVASRRGRREAMPWRSLAWLLLPFGTLALQWAWNARFGLQNDLLGANESGRSMFALLLEHGPERLPVVLEVATAAMTSLMEPHAVFLVLLLAPLCWPRVALQGALLPLTLTLLLSLCGLHLVYLGTHLDLPHHLLTSYLRVTWQLVPATLVWFAALARAVYRGGAGGSAGDQAGT